MRDKTFDKPIADLPDMNGFEMAYLFTMNGVETQCISDSEDLFTVGDSEELLTRTEAIKAFFQRSIPNRILGFQVSEVSHG